MATIPQSIDGKHFQNYAEHATSKKCSFHHSDSHKMSLPLASIIQTQSCSSNPNTRAVTILKLMLYVFVAIKLLLLMNSVTVSLFIPAYSESSRLVSCYRRVTLTVSCICISTICICLLSPTSDPDSAREAIVFEENHIELDKTATLIVF